MFYAGNPVVIEPGMGCLLHRILMNSDRGRTMTLGQMVRVTENGCERLSRHPLDRVLC